MLACCSIGLADGARAQRSERLDVVHEHRGKPVKLKVELQFPEQSGEKLPAILISHGSAGVSDNRERAYAREFLKLGVAAAIVDSYMARGVGSTARDQGAVSAHEMLVDAVETLRVMARHPRVDPERVGLVGFSKGGTVVIKAALQRYVAPLAKGEAGFAVLVALYPWCGDFALDFRPAGSRVSTLLGSDDTYSGTAACLEYGKKLQQASANATVKVYASAKHGWDVPGPAVWSDPKGQNQSKCIYDEIERNTWVERVSQIKVVENNKPTGNRPKALARCMTLGVSGGYNRQAHTETLQDIRTLVRDAFRLK